MVFNSSHEGMVDDSSPTIPEPVCVVEIAHRGLVSEPYPAFARRCDTLHYPCHSEPKPVRVMQRPTLSDLLRMAQEKKENGPWVPANNGTEVPFITRMRRRLQYMWQPSTGRHAYYDCDQDLILSDEDARLALGMD